MLERPERVLGLGRAGSTDGEALEFADALLSFLAAARRTRGRMQPLFDDVTVPQLVLLDAIEECGAEGIRAVADFTSLSQPTITRSAAALEREGLVRRLASDGDGRRRVLSLTPRGERLLAEKRAIVARQFAVAWDGLDASQRALAVPLLRRLSTLVDQLF
jgi:DNA-binding MarR family transcriptional regulator